MTLYIYMLMIRCGGVLLHVCTCNTHSLHSYLAVLAPPSLCNTGRISSLSTAKCDPGKIRVSGYLQVHVNLYVHVQQETYMYMYTNLLLQSILHVHVCSPFFSLILTPSPPQTCVSTLVDTGRDRKTHFRAEHQIRAQWLGDQCSKHQAITQDKSVASHSPLFFVLLCTSCRAWTSSTRSISWGLWAKDSMQHVSCLHVHVWCMHAYILMQSECLAHTSTPSMPGSRWSRVCNFAYLHIILILSLHSTFTV